MFGACLRASPATKAIKVFVCLLPSVLALGPCAQALLVVAHPDDESMYAGELILGRAASLPGGCRRASWHVVCATGAGTERSEDLRRALEVARRHGLAFEITWEIWDFPDCNNPECGNFEATAGPSIQERLEVLLTTHNWDYVITHNPQGENGHHQHIGLNFAVTQAVNLYLWKFVSTRPRLFVFNLLPELDLNISVGKQRMLLSFLAGTGYHEHRPMILDGEARFSEHLMPPGAFARPDVLRLLGFHPGLPPWASHFWYVWNAWQEGIGAFDASKASKLLARMLARVNTSSCAGLMMPQYPRVCMALRRAEGKKERLRHLREMEASFEAVFMEDVWEKPSHLGQASYDDNDDDDTLGEDDSDEDDPHGAMLGDVGSAYPDLEDDAFQPFFAEGRWAQLPQFEHGKFTLEDSDLSPDIDLSFEEAFKEGRWSSGPLQFDFESEGLSTRAKPNQVPFPQDLLANDDYSSLHADASFEQSFDFGSEARSTRAKGNQVPMLQDMYSSERIFDSSAGDDGSLIPEHWRDRSSSNGLEFDTREGLDMQGHRDFGLRMRSVTDDGTWPAPIFADGRQWNSHLRPGGLARNIWDDDEDMETQGDSFNSRSDIYGDGWFNFGNEDGSPLVDEALDWPDPEETLLDSEETAHGRSKMWFGSGRYNWPRAEEGLNIDIGDLNIDIGDKAENDNIDYFATRLDKTSLGGRIHRSGAHEFPSANPKDCFTSESHFQDCCCLRHGRCEWGNEVYHDCCDHLVEHCSI